MAAALQLLAGACVSTLERPLCRKRQVCFVLPLSLRFRKGTPLQLPTRFAAVRLSRGWVLAGISLVALIVLALVFLPFVERALVPRLAPRIRQDLVSVLAQKSGSAVSVDTLAVSYDGAVQVQGTGLRLQSVLHGVAGNAARPMLRVQNFSFRTNFLSLLSAAPHLHQVRLRGVFLELPPVAAQGSGGAGGKKITIQHAVVDDAHITFASGDPQRAPLVFDLPHAVLSGIRPNKPFRFQVTVDNGPPIGRNEASGSIGPWNFDDPRNTPVSGQFGFQNRDVSSVPGLKGRLSLDGRFQGTFAQMRAEGTTEDPAFGLDVSSRTVPLTTRFRLLLDATASVIHLEQVDAQYLQTPFSCKGQITKNTAYPGYDLDLQIDVNGGRIEDALSLASQTTPPLLKGAFAMQGALRMHAGPERVARKLQLSAASFQADHAMFASPQVQGEVRAMSERASGHPHDATLERASPVSAQARGEVSLMNAEMTFQRTQVQLTGAQALISGRYLLGRGSFRFQGKVHTDAKAWQMTTGLKSALLRPFSGMFAHGSPGATFPLNVQGEGSKVSMDVMLPGGKRVSAAKP